MNPASDSRPKGGSAAPSRSEGQRLQAIPTTPRQKRLLRCLHELSIHIERTERNLAIMRDRKDRIANELLERP